MHRLVVSTISWRTNACLDPFLLIQYYLGHMRIVVRHALMMGGGFWVSCLIGSLLDAYLFCNMHNIFSKKKRLLNKHYRYKYQNTSQSSCKLKRL